MTTFDALQARLRVPTLFSHLPSTKQSWAWVVARGGVVLAAVFVLALLAFVIVARAPVTVAVADPANPLSLLQSESFAVPAASTVKFPSEAGEAPSF